MSRAKRELPELRAEAWGLPLRALLREWRGRQFEWGVSDCIQLAMEVRGVVYDIDPATEVYGTYSTLEDGLNIMHAEAGSLRGAFDYYCKEKISPDEARLGDVGMTLTAFGPMVHVYLRRGRSVTFDRNRGLHSTDNVPKQGVWRF